MTALARAARWRAQGVAGSPRGQATLSAASARDAPEASADPESRAAHSHRSFGRLTGGHVDGHRSVAPLRSAWHRSDETGPIERAGA
eukprot:1305168-Alexandrium_andersonii.AAC.1